MDGLTTDEHVQPPLTKPIATETCGLIWLLLPYGMGWWGDAQAEGGAIF